jgi:ferredoxin/truncated hemoglobin YjbI
MSYVHHSQLGTLRLKPDETVLNACLRLGLEIPFSCRGGSCHTCMMRCTGGALPERAQRGLSTAQQSKSYFLPCVCIPTADLHIAPIASNDIVTVCVLDSIRVEATQQVWLLEPTRTPPTMDLRQKVYLTRVESALSGAWQGQVCALPETHYFLEVALPLAHPHDVPAVGTQVALSLQQSSVATPTEALKTKLPTDPQLWQELDEGKRVRQILDAFYAKVFADERLAPYFQHTTAHHVAGKQYAFLYESMTGEDVYFGDNPYNAHHGMVISDALFDHRQHLMLETLEEHGLSDDQIRRWTAFEEPYRPQIVKAQVMPRIGNAGVETRPDGFGEETLTEGSVCDHCGAAIAAGTVVLYHRRLGSISCPACAPILQPRP